MLTGRVHLDLSEEPDLFSSHDRKELAALDDLPNGVAVVVDIGSRRWVSPDTAEFLHRNVHRLDIVIDGTPRADIRAWLEAARTGRVGVAS